MLDVENPITAALEHLDFVVETFNKATGIPSDEEIGDVFQPVQQGLDEKIKTGQATLLNSFDPSTYFSFSRGFCNIEFEDGGQLLPELISQF